MNICYMQKEQNGKGRKQEKFMWGIKSYILRKELHGIALLPIPR